MTISFSENHPKLVTLIPQKFTIGGNASGNFNISMQALSAGTVEITGVATPGNVIDTLNLFFRIIIANSRLIIYVSATVGWIYFVAWSISFYPQMFINYNRKSVVGLSFDFLAMNFMGHTLYAIFNTCLYFVPFFQHEYFKRFPQGVNPVELNDVFFSIHASIITALTVLQCFLYEVKFLMIGFYENFEQICLYLLKFEYFLRKLIQFIQTFLQITSFLKTFYSKTNLKCCFSLQKVILKINLISKQLKS